MRFGRANPGKIINPPDDAGCSEIKTCVTVLTSVVEGMRRPETLRIEMSERIGDDFLDRQSGIALVPAVA